MNTAMDLYAGLNLNPGINQSSLTGVKVSDCAGHGVHVGTGVSVAVRGLEVNRVGLNGIHFEGVSPVPQLKDKVSEMQELAELPSLKPIHSELIPLLTAIKEELEKPEPSKPSVQGRFADLNRFLGGVNQSLAASGIFLALQALAEQAHVWVK
jgi:hypothetical protein